VSESDVALTAAGHAAVMEEPAYALQPKKLTMWLFIISDSVTFGAVLFAYGFLRVGSTDWSTPFKFASIANGMVMTFVLLSSSLTMLGAVLSAKAGRRSSSVKWMGLTVLLGVVFAALHIREWIHMIHEGWRLFQNPTGGSVEFGAAFFCITGLHLLHVTCGVIAITVVAIGYKRGWLTEGHVETTSLYWHFVDVVWMFVFPLMYLMNAAR
jgi:cytochrome c oxidase subunit III